MGICIMMITTTVTLIPISLSIITVTRTIMAITIIEADDQHVAMRREVGRLTRKEARLH